MAAELKSTDRRREAGSALLIAIFALLLISVVGLALMVSTGTDSALAGNYRSSTGAYYAAVAGLEEARGRLLWKNPDFINKTNAYAGLFSGQGNAAFGLTDVLYILNPAGGETVNPLDSSSPYADKEYGAEFTWGLGTANVVTPTNSVSAMAGLPGPAYKWVRINAVTEKALGVDVDSDGSLDGTKRLFYNGSGLNVNGSGNVALEITAFVLMPDNSTRLLQYLVAPTSLNMTFSAALTLAGNGVSYTGPNSTGFYINGNDPTAGRTCATPPAAAVPAIGITNSGDQATVAAGTSSFPSNYEGFTPPPPAPPTPSIATVTLPANLQKPSQVEAFIQMITTNSDVQISKAPAVATGSDLPSGMSPTNPLTVVVNGDLDLNAWHNTGYGILLVTGSLNYDPDASWEGIVLVLGKGVVTGSRMGIGRFDGAFMVAQSRDPSTGNVLPDPNLGASSVTFAPNMGGYGIYYNTCTILQALAPTSYRVLSFREITQ